MDLTGWSQHKQRYSEDDNHSGKFFTDQHGREFHAEVELKTGEPCSPLVLCAPWSQKAPWRPDGNYMVRATGQRGRRAQGVAYDYSIDYDRLIQECTQAWQERARRTAEIRSEFPHLTDDQVAIRLGRPPMHPAVFEQMKNGHPWLLGLRSFNEDDELDRWLAKYVSPKTLPASFDWTGDRPPTHDVPETVLADDPVPTRRRQKIEV